jgi:hypothetical protein
MHIRRWASSAVASLAILIGLASPAAAAPPPNGDIANAVVVSSLPFTTSMSTVCGGMRR